MSDASEITDLVHRYAFLVDDGDLEGVASLFEHSTWRSDRSDTVRRGAAEVRPVYEQLLTPTGAPRTRHLLTNLTVLVDPEATSASSRCYWTVLAADGVGPISVALSGQYIDRFAKADGRWHFADRLITTDLAGPQGDRRPVLG